MGGRSSLSKTFVVQLDPATLLMEDDTDAAVTKTLQMVTDSKAGLYSNSTGPSRQATDSQSGVLFPDASLGIPLSEMSSSVARGRRPNPNVGAAGRRDDESVTTATAAATADDHAAAIRRVDTESGGHQAAPSAESTGLRTPLNKARTLLIMFLLQAIFYVFFAVTLAGAGPGYLYGIPSIISIMGSAIAVATVITNFSLQIREGRGSEGN